MGSHSNSSQTFLSDTLDPSDRLRAMEAYIYGASPLHSRQSRLTKLSETNECYNKIERAVGKKLFVSTLSTSGYVAKPNAAYSQNIVINTYISGDALVGSERVRSGDITINHSKNCRLVFDAGTYSRLYLPKTCFASPVDSKDKLVVLRRDDPTTSVLRGTAEAVEDAIKQGDNSRIEIVEDLMIFVAQRILENALLTHSTAGYDHVRDRAVEYIRDNLHRADLSVAEVAHFAGVSRATLYRAFESLGGIKQFINMERISSAKSMLRLGSTDRGQISAVAYSAGFSSPEQFSKVFKAQTGMAPSQYVKTV